jgi:hypothetical protein
MDHHLTWETFQPLNLHQLKLLKGRDLTFIMNHTLVIHQIMKSGNDSYHMISYVLRRTDHHLIWRTFQPQNLHGLLQLLQLIIKTLTLLNVKLTTLTGTDVVISGRQTKNSP